MKKARALSWHHASLYVSNGIHGLGVFSQDFLPANTLITLFGGHIMTLDQEHSLPSGIKDFGLQIHDNFVIGPALRSEVSLTDRFNHSCEPNCGFQGQIALVTIKDVEREVELTFDYAMVLAGEKYELLCDCGAKACRKFVTADDWKICRLQTRYNGYFQPYIEEKMAKRLKKGP